MRRGEPRYNSLEIVVRIKDPNHWVRSEWTVRGDRVELRTFWPNGQIERHTEVSFDQFYEEFQKCNRQEVPS